ncbi:hypothetical protein K7432_000905 [Basidiobolus ranarum]|uniref:rRNA methyltransferase 1, mitochondrial n=1 Tax=Basidiobolus ranarum TaxID=34480 RepID=A0ABR2WAJ3_9FUNG
MFLRKSLYSLTTPWVGSILKETRGIPFFLVSRHASSKSNWKKQFGKKSKSPSPSQETKNESEFDLGDIFNATKNIKVWDAIEEPRLMKRLKNGEPNNRNCDLLYGYSVVLPALESKRRVPYRLFYRGETETTKKEDSDKLDTILGLAEELQLPIQKMDRRELNEFTGNRPHQGVILKTDRLEPITINRLSKVDDETYYAVSGSGEYHFKSEQSPIWLALDQVVDPQNLGAILRSAYYFGIDGVVFCARNSAPLSPVVSKASSGALEVMDVYSVKNMMRFLRESQENGWTVIGASAEKSSDGRQAIDPVAMSEINSPRILVMGNEGFGLRSLVSESCQIHVSIPSTNPTIAPFLDSLNVSVATGILLHMLAVNRKPSTIA